MSIPSHVSQFHHFILCALLHICMYIMMQYILFQVIAQTIADARRCGMWEYADRSDVCERRGSGNNWACGYCVHGQKAAGPTLEAVRRAVESCDRFTGFVIHMSLAGGTGSGLGSYLTHRLRDDYPHSFIINQVLHYFESFNNRYRSQRQHFSCLGSQIFLKIAGVSVFVSLLIAINKFDFKALISSVSAC